MTSITTAQAERLCSYHHLSSVQRDLHIKKKKKKKAMQSNAQSMSASAVASLDNCGNVPTKALQIFINCFSVWEKYKQRVLIISVF